MYAGQLKFPEKLKRKAIGMSKQEISLSFPKEKEEEIAVFLLEDLIKEYNSSVIISPPYRNKYPLSLKSLNEKNAIIRPMTQAEIDSLRFYELQAGEWHNLKKISVIKLAEMDY